MHARAFGHTDVGKIRTSNEDAYWIDEDLGAFLVCDGMGGHANGALAARLSVEAVARSLRDSASVLSGVASRAEGGHTRLASLAVDAARSACRAVYEEASRNPACRGMGCTLTLLLVANGRAAMAHVGDTRLYLLRDGSVDQLSTDHTVAAELVRKGQITPEEARGHALASALTRAVGVQEIAEVETLIFDLAPDDVLLLCSDGLGRAVDSLGELAPFLSVGEVEGAPDALIDLANERDGSDNATAVVVAVDATDDERIESDATSEELRRDLSVLRESELLSGLPLADLLRLYAIGDVVQCERGVSLLGGSGDLEGLYCVLSGKVHWEPQEGDVRSLSAGECFGGPALLVQGIRPAALRADSDARLLVVLPEPLRRLAAVRPRLALTLLSRIMQRAFTGAGASGSLPRAAPAGRRKTWWNPSAWARMLR